MLAETTLARPYARAAFSLADQAGTVDNWSALLSRAAAAVEEPVFLRLVDHPSVEDDKLMKLFDDVLGDSSDTSFKGFLRVLMHYRRLPLLPEIAAQFETLKRAREQRLKVEVISAVEMSSDQVDRLADRLRQRFGSEIEMELGVDRDLLGGLIVRAGDKVIDASIRGRLRQLGRQLVR